MELVVKRLDSRPELVGATVMLADSRAQDLAAQRARVAVVTKHGELMSVKPDSVRAQNAVELPRSTLMTFSVYSCPAINVVESENQRSTVAVSNIRSETLLLIEHVFAGSNIMVHSALNEDSLLRGQLFPRAPDADLGLKVWHCSEFMEMGLEEPERSLGLRSTMINFSSSPNATLVWMRLDGAPVHFAMVQTIKDVVAGEEITVDFGPGYHSTRGGVDRPGRGHAVPFNPLR